MAQNTYNTYIKRFEMQDSFRPWRVENAAGMQDYQAKIRTPDDVPARYRNHPDFEALTNDPAHGGHPEPKVLREAMSALQAAEEGKLKAPVSRPTEGYIDFYDGDGHPIDVKTPLSPCKSDKWEFDAPRNAETVLRQLDKDYPNKLTGENEPVRVLLDTTYMKPADRAALWHELNKHTKENRSILNNIAEVNVDLGVKGRLNPALTKALLTVRGR